jgi:hypothetical protein
MKQNLLLFIAISVSLHAVSQITTPQIKANFGVDADLRANYFNNGVVTGNDEWFNNGTPGAGKFVIDTSGASAIVNGYYADESNLNKTIIRTMSFAPFSIVNNDKLIDAVFVRDYRGDDSTSFAAGSNKNGMSPASWSTPVSKPVPDKNEILDMFMHVRRGGSKDTDSLWMFAGLSIENTTGDRYFDFEMFQTDFYYDRTTLTFKNYGPDAGHTSWKFDASGNVTQPGDIILTAEFGTASITLVEARIWVNKNDMVSITPKTFSWGALYDGDGSGAQFGYANILPKTPGAFYIGLQSTKDTWGGPFAIVLGNGSINTNYVPRQFMEFAVNLTKLGLDPVTLLGGSTCSMPFRKLAVKTRSSTSFTSELKDFVAPVSFLDVKKAKSFSNVPYVCATSTVTTINITNPVATSVYTWSTPDGHIADSSNKLAIIVDAPGTYIVTQRIQAQCPVYATDTFKITFDTKCGILAGNLSGFSGVLSGKKVGLAWKYLLSSSVKHFDIERSTDGIHYVPVSQVAADGKTDYTATDNILASDKSAVYYRLKITGKAGDAGYSPTIKVELNSNQKISISPNPVKNVMNLNIYSGENKTAQVKIYDLSGRPVRSMNISLRKGNNSIPVTGFETWNKGVYLVKTMIDGHSTMQRMLLSK